MARPVAIGYGLRRYRSLFALGFHNLRQHRLRTLLTSAGVILGTAAIGATLTLTLAFRTRLIQDFASFGANRLTIIPYQLEVKFGLPAQNPGVKPGAPFDDQDVAAVKEQLQVSAASPFGQADLPVAHRGQVLRMAVLFVDPATYLDVAAAQPEKGRFLQQGRSREVVLGYAAARDAFHQRC